MPTSTCSDLKKKSVNLSIDFVNALHLTMVVKGGGGGEEEEEEGERIKAVRNRVYPRAAADDKIS